MTLRLVVVFGLLLLATAAATHEAPSGWSYPPECCGGHDCAKIADKRVTWRPGFYVVDGTHSMPEDRVRWSEDEHWHACFYPAERLWCLFRPRIGS